MLGGKVRELWAAGLVVLGPDYRYQLTAVGARRRQEAQNAYAAMNVAAGK